MTTTARTATRLIVMVTAGLVAPVLASLAEEFDDCQMCGEASAYLYTRLDLDDLTEVEVCEDCADNAHLGYVAD